MTTVITILALMDILLTLPPCFARYLLDHKEDFPSVTAVFSDPEDHKLGSGGGTVHVLWRHGVTPERIGDASPDAGRRIIIHSDGQSRRLPAYAPSGKSFIPFPVFRWGRGQRIDQTLFDVQRPLLEKILSRAPEGMNTLVVSGDAMVHTDFFQEDIPVADVVCIGIWAQPEIASRHGVFVVPREDPTRLLYMLQKPSVEKLQTLTGHAMYLLDAGIWLLSDRAVRLLFNETGWDEEHHQFVNGLPEKYDLYTGFGGKLGEEADGSLSLTARIIPLEKGEFYHFGSNADLLRSTCRLHGRVLDQREIWHKKIKPSPEIFVQNARTGLSFGADHKSIWIENSWIPESWSLHDHHILTGIPENDWNLDLPAGTCIDVVPVDSGMLCFRPYGFDDAFRGMGSDPATTWLNRPMRTWFETHGFTAEEAGLMTQDDIYELPLFPVTDEKDSSVGLIRWMISPAPGDAGFRKAWLDCERLSAREVILRANHARIAAMRRTNLERSLSALAANSAQSVFYQLDLDHVAGLFRENSIPLPPVPSADTGVMTRVHDLMFRSAYHREITEDLAGSMERQAFEKLREGMISGLTGHSMNPVLNVLPDQILWGRSPVRFDLAGGWTDTPPYCIIYGGKVVNMAVNLNGQPPIQAYVRPTKTHEIVLRSFDLGETEVVRDYQDLSDISRVGSAFAIPRAALMLAGFHPDFSAIQYGSLKEQLKAFGGGLDVSLMVAVPKGSGLGTSSILAATLLGVLSACCTLGWDRYEIAYRTLLLEQLLTTGGGWQDQFGGLFEGIKLIESQPGLIQRPIVSWAPEQLFTNPDSREQVLLYYTGVTRVAKNILADIVKGMFLNSSGHLGILSEMKCHALNTYESIRHNDWKGLSSAIRYSWELNNRLDSGTNPPEVAAIIRKIDDLALSYKLLGAGGGGYLMILPKEPEAAKRIRSQLGDRPPNGGARFVEWGISKAGMEITQS